jgi:hypothetical protein
MTNDTGRLRQLLRDKYPPPEWLMSFEVQAERDEGGLRFADALAFNTRKAAGLGLHGFELKVSRSDWLHELRFPEKALPARQHCDYWWIVVGSDGIVEQGELPERVGFMRPGRDGQLEVQRFAMRLTDFRKPTLDRQLMAAFLARLDPLEPRAYWDGKLRVEHRKGYARGLSEAKRGESHARLQGRIKEPSVPEGQDFCP